MAGPVNIPYQAVGQVAPVAPVVAPRGVSPADRLAAGTLPIDNITLTLAAQMVNRGRVTLKSAARSRGLSLRRRSGGPVTSGRSVDALRRESRDLSLDQLSRALAVDAAP